MVGAFVLAFAQRPGLQTADTKINLHVAPGRFLGQVATMWSATGQLGGVQAGQQSGYLFPMGPFFAAGHLLGAPDWVLQRLWLGLLLAALGVGTIMLLRALLGPARRAALLSGAAVAVLNPFVVTYVNRTTVTLLALAVLPWLLLAVHRGLAEPRSWRWPAMIALLIAVSGPGVNAAVTGWMLLAPVTLAIYELWLHPARRKRPAVGFLLRTLLLVFLTSLWWLIPAFIQSHYGNAFLSFTEQPGTVWGTTSASETLRLMGFWLSYVGIGFAGRAIPYFDDAPTLLFSAPVVLATLLLPACALGGFAWTRRWRYGPFFVLLTILGALIVGAGYPDGTPLRHGLYFLYNHVAALQFLRTSYKAGPLLVISLAALVAALVEYSGARLTPWAKRAAVLAGGSVLALAAWPMTTGRAQDRQVSFRAVPAAWRAVAADLDRDLPAGSRAIVLPGELFAFYRWGGTVDPILPALTSRPVAERTEVPYADPRATDLLWEIDALVSQRRLLPGQLDPLLSLIGVRSIVTATDLDPARSDSPSPADVAAELGTASAAYGPRRGFAPTDSPGSSVVLPEVRRADLSTARPGVRLEPRSAPLVVDGSAATLAGLASFGQLPSGRPIRYAGDLSPSALRATFGSGGELVIGDSNRRQAFAASTLEQDRGPILTAADTVSADGVILDPFGRGADFETVAVYDGISDVRSPASPQTPQFPEHAAFAALDGDPATFWLADPTLDPARRRLEVDFTEARNIPIVSLLPYGGVRAVTIAGRTYVVHAGWNRLPLHLRNARTLTVGLDGQGWMGIRELRIPGLHPARLLRLPIDGTHALSGMSLNGVSLEYVFERVTGDDPLRRDPLPSTDPLDPLHPGDAETVLARRFTLPVARTFTARAWLNVAATAPDPVLDRLAGYRGAVIVSSSGRAAGLPGDRGSRAFDGNPRTAWVAPWRSGIVPWLEWKLPRPVRLPALRLVPAAAPVGVPTRVELSWPGGSSGPLTVGPGGRVRLPRPPRASRYRLAILAAGPAARPYVGIAEVLGAKVPAVREAAGPLRAGCGSVVMRLGSQRLALRPGGTIAQFDAGDAVPAASCGRGIGLAAGEQTLLGLPGPLLVDELALRSPGAGAATVDAGTVAARYRSDGTPVSARLDVREPAWLVIGQGYDRGWRASCDGHSLGAPVPIDGYANGWPVGPGCRKVSFAFAPQGTANIGYVVSALAGVLCLALIIVRRRKATIPLARTGASAARPARRTRSPRPLPLGRALLTAVAVAAAFGVVFGLRAGAVALPVTALLLWRGAEARQLTAGVGLLLGVVVPLLYLWDPASSAGGNHAGYPAQHLAAHWAAVAAIGLLLAAVALTLPEVERGAPD